VLSAVRHRLTDTITIERPTTSGFDQSTTWTIVNTVDGYLYSTGGDESIDYGGDNIRSTHRLIGPVTDVTESDRIERAGKRYLVRYVDEKSLGGESWLQIDLEYIGAAA